MIRKFLLILFATALFFQSCLMKEGTKNNSVKILRFTGTQYSTLKKPVFRRGERIFFSVPVFDFILSDKFGNLVFF